MVSFSLLSWVSAGALLGKSQHSEQDTGLLLLLTHASLPFCKAVRSLAMSGLPYTHNPKSWQLVCLILALTVLMWAFKVHQLVFRFLWGANALIIKPSDLKMTPRNWNLSFSAGSRRSLSSHLILSFLLPEEEQHLLWEDNICRCRILTISVQSTRSYSQTDWTPELSNFIAVATIPRSTRT